MKGANYKNSHYFYSGSTTNFDQCTLAYNGDMTNAEKLSIIDTKIYNTYCHSDL